MCRSMNRACKNWPVSSTVVTKLTTLDGSLQKRHFLQMTGDRQHREGESSSQRLSRTGSGNVRSAMQIHAILFDLECPTSKRSATRLRNSWMSRHSCLVVLRCFLEVPTNDPCFARLFAWMLVGRACALLSLALLFDDGLWLMSAFFGGREPRLGWLSD